MSYIYIASIPLLCTVFFLLRHLVKKNPLDNIPGPPPKSFWKGNFIELFNPNAWDFHHRIAKDYGNVVRIDSFFGDKQLFVFDPQALYHIIIKDQTQYDPSPQAISGNLMIFGKGLLSTLGSTHRKQRKMLNPVFSIAHMRAMTPVFYSIAHKLRDTLTAQVKAGPKEASQLLGPSYLPSNPISQIDMLHWMARTALELIGQSGLGHSFDSLTVDAPPSVYAESIKELIPVVFKMFAARTYILPWAIHIGPASFRRFIVNILPWKTLHQARDKTDLMYRTSVDIYNAKKRALESGDDAAAQQITEANDIMGILMRANMEASEQDRLAEDELIGQMSTLIFAAMDTTSTALSRTLQLLTANTESQEKLRQEIKAAREENGGDIPYNELTTLPYLDAVCRETLRLYPPVSQIVKTANQDTVLPLSSPMRGVDGSELNEIFVPKDTYINVSILSANRNPDIWGPDALDWKPERWLNPLPSTVKNAPNPGVYSHLMTFSGGGKSCIGFKFSQLEMKVVLAVLLDTFRFSPVEKEIYWEMASIASPIVKEVGSDLHQLPCQVALA
ncbi:cytochrome P450 [Mycena floridula]|nr:cytochrome P450 [Mycena floridula]